MTESESSTHGELELQTRVYTPSELTPELRSQMLSLMRDHYESVDAEQFEHDLAEKDCVIVTADASRGILGFTTLLRMTARIDDQPIHGLFSGDTVLDPAIWGANAWARVWGRLAAEMMEELDGAPLYWLLLTATQRTYRFLRSFLCEYYPRPEVETPEFFQRRMDALVRLKFEHDYDAALGIVSTPRPLSVRAQRQELVTRDLDDIDGQFFAQRNPHYLRGDYLVCIGDLSAGNRTRLGKRFFTLNDR